MAFVKDVMYCMLEKGITKLQDSTLIVKGHFSFFLYFETLFFKLILYIYIYMYVF